MPSVRELGIAWRSCLIFLSKRRLIWRGCLVWSRYISRCAFKSDALSQAVEQDLVERKKKLNDDDIEKLLCGDEEEPKEDSRTCNLKRKSRSPPYSPIIKKRTTRIYQTPYENHEQGGSSKEQFKQRSDGNESNAELFERGNVEDVLMEKIDDEERDGGRVMVHVRFGEVFKSSEKWDHFGSARDKLFEDSRLHMPSCLVTEAKRNDKDSLVMNKLAAVSLTRSSLLPMPTFPILDPGNLKGVNTAGKGSNGLRSSLASVHLLVQKVKQSGRSLASSLTTPSSWQNLGKAADPTKSPAGPGRLSRSRRRSKNPETTVMATGKITVNEELADVASIEESNSNDGSVEEVESESEEEYTPHKAGRLKCRNSKSKVKPTKGKGRGKGRKPKNRDQPNISKYFKPKDETADMDEEVEEVEDVEGIDQAGCSPATSFLGKCPLCDQSFDDMNHLSIHASNCQGTM